MPTCEEELAQLKGIIAELTNNRNAWAVLSNEVEGSVWDDGFNSYHDREEELLRNAGGHPTGPKPRRRPY